MKADLLSGVAEHDCYASIWEVEAGVRNSRPGWATSDPVLNKQK